MTEVEEIARTHSTGRDFPDHGVGHPVPLQYGNGSSVAPVSYQAALTLGVVPHAFLMAVAMAASSAFLTPIASPVNTIVLAAGGYRFSDFFRIGLPLLLLMMGLAVVFLPLLFPL